MKLMNIPLYLSTLEFKDWIKLSMNYPYYKMPDIYHKYDIFIDQHLNPIKSKMCLEAMSCGLPVVTYDGNFLLNGKQNREYIVKYHDANKLITRLLKIYQELIM